MQMLTNMFLFTPAEPHSSVGSIQDLRTGGRWFDFRLDQFSFQVFMMIIPFSLFRQWLCGKAASGFKRILVHVLCGVLVKRAPGKHGLVH